MPRVAAGWARPVIPTVCMDTSINMVLYDKIVSSCLYSFLFSARSRPSLPELTLWRYIVYHVHVNIIPPPQVEPADARQAAVLEAAVGVFARFGFRKASMDEVARAAGVSRQGLYLQFANQEELVRKAPDHSLNNQLSAAVAALARGEDGLEIRLIAACDAWSGRFLRSPGAAAGALMCATLPPS